ncbi:urease accessory protein UreE [Rhodobacter ferrooxidans]|uniref:Urease accessory protein UreE n=1 Tax=Rhodobacter ferrooxidans TaxID=371731 RepID=C8RX19_9RHOB|nr:urease accessory protein UreE [Rhodobacter sp. SW2]EEW26544.1 UreE urease accessory domain protein [Rhodobacter sp. SW2]
MTKLPVARSLRHQGDWDGAYDLVVLEYDDRLLRKKRLETVHEESFVVDLPEIEAVGAGDAFLLDDGRLIEVIAAEEDVLVLTGDLPLLTWHLGRRQAAVQIEADRLLVQADKVPEALMRDLGAQVTAAREPFTPDVHPSTAAAEHGRSHPRVHHHGAHIHPEDDDIEPAAD